MLLQYIVNGITLGSIYALMAIGYAMVFSILELINFSHGQVFMLGGIFGFYALQLIPGPAALGLLAAVLLTGVVGIGVEQVAIRPLRNRKASTISALITTLGMGIFIENIVLIVSGSDYKSFEAPFEVHSLEFLGTRITTLELLIVGLSIALMLILNFFIFKTKYGQAIRACSQDIETTSLMGINVNSVISITFATGAMLAAVAGILIGFYYGFVEPAMGSLVGLKGFTASVLGGRGMISGGVLGGIVLGLLESLGSMIFTAQYRDIIAFIVLILMLLIKPEGILGKRRAK